MIPELGHFSLILALVLAGAQCHPVLCRRAALLQLPLLLTGFSALAWSFIVCDFTVVYVAEHTHTLLPPAAKLAGFFGHGAGIALSVALLLSWSSGLLVFRKANKKWLHLTGVIGAVVIACLLFLNPFERIYPPPFDGMAFDPLEAETATPGTPLPPFTIEELSSQDIQGPAVINFFASWCAPCEAEIPVLMKLSETVPVYGIAFKNNDKDSNDFLNEHGNPYAKARYGYDPDGKAANAFGISGVPSTFVIDADNVIRYRHEAPLTDEDIPDIKEALQ